MKIAVLLTCFNRKEKTLSCLSSLYNALSLYNDKNENKIEISVYLTDDGCTDGTGDAIRNNFSDKNINILQGIGNLFWAGGMRFAWNEALKKHNEWDFYLLLNDDTDLLDNLFEELMNTHQYCLENYKKSGIYSGITSAKSYYNKIT
jgi:GT2 family glycosyltransferase